MSKLTIDANLLDFDGNSLQDEVVRANSGVLRLERRTPIQEFNSVIPLGLTNANATFAKIFNAMQLNSRLTLTVTGGNYPLLDTPVDFNNVFQSGTVFIEGNQISPGRVSVTFLNENGVWFRYLSNAYAVGNAFRDSGWLQYTHAGVNRQPSTAQLTATFGGLLSNIKEPGDYFIAGSSLNSAVTDSPYGTTGNPAIHLRVVRLQADRGIIQTIRAAVNGQSGYRRFISNANVVGGWSQEVVGGTPLVFDLSSQHVSPKTTNLYNLGGASNVYANLYVQNAPIVVSDRNMKEDIGPISDEVLDAWKTVEYSKWKMKAAVEVKGYDEARYHFGIVAQEIKEKFEEAGLDATDYGILIYDEWEAVEEDAENGVEAKEAGSCWMVRMEECLALEAALLRRTQERLEARIDALEAKE